VTIDFVQEITSIYYCFSSRYWSVFAAGETMDKRLKEVCKLLLLVAVLLFAPIWIPIAVVVIATTILVVGGILAALAMVTFTILSFLLGVIGLPALLFCITVTAFAYIAFTILKTIAEKIRRIMKPYIKGKTKKAMIKYYT
jgi:hypothetical protein